MDYAERVISEKGDRYLGEIDVPSVLLDNLEDLKKARESQLESLAHITDTINKVSSDIKEVVEGR